MPAAIALAAAAFLHLPAGGQSVSSSQALLLLVPPWQIEPTSIDRQSLGSRLLIVLPESAQPCCSLPESTRLANIMLIASSDSPRYTLALGVCEKVGSGAGVSSAPGWSRIVGSTTVVVNLPFS